jgi:hypothetical protein
MIRTVVVRIPAEGEIQLGARLFLPEGAGRRPAVTMAHSIERFAEAFSTAGFSLLVHDHCSFRDERRRTPRRYRSVASNCGLASRDFLS